jgi:hypothetical protein
LAKLKRKEKEQESKEKEQESKPRKFTWIPAWGWVLIFAVPLVLSEYMFYRVGRRISMVLFPIFWIGFWYTVMRRGGWPILQRQEDD